jgi:hypothetical protein
VRAAVQEAPQPGHPSGGQRLLEDRTREPVDLDDQEAPRTGRGRGAKAETPGEPVDRALGAETLVGDGLAGSTGEPVSARWGPSSAAA